MAKLDDIRRAVEQRQQAPSPPDPASPPRERPPGSRPYVAQMGDVIKDGLLGENQRLKAEREGGMVLTHVQTIAKWVPESQPASLFLVLFRKP